MDGDACGTACGFCGRCTPEYDAPDGYRTRSLEQIIMQDCSHITSILLGHARCMVCHHDLTHEFTSRQLSETPGASQ